MLSIVVPSFNEKPNIEPLLREIDKALENVVKYEVIFVDDSTDDTPILLANIAEKNPCVRFLHRKNKGGLASAVVEGFGLAKGDVIAVMDADLQHPPALLAPLYRKIEEGTDVALPSRYVNGGGSEGLSFPRMLASKGARLASQIFLKSMRNITDPMSGNYMMRRSVIDGVKLNPLGWKILMEVLALGNYKTVAEIPYHFDKRYAGESKLTFKVTVQYFLHILSLVARSERDRRVFVFLLVGFSGMCIDMLLFWLITSYSTSVSINIAATISAFAGLVNNFLLNRNITWKSQKGRNALGEFKNYVIVNGIGIGIKNIAVYLLVRVGFSGLSSNFCGIVSASLWNFLMTDRFVFRSKKSVE